MWKLELGLRGQQVQEQHLLLLGLGLRGQQVQEQQVLLLGLGLLLLRGLLHREGYRFPKQIFQPGLT
jgi:hypothetical protein